MEIISLGCVSTIMEKRPELKGNAFLKYLLFSRIEQAWHYYPSGMTGIKQWQIKPGTTIIKSRAVPQF